MKSFTKSIQRHFSTQCFVLHKSEVIQKGHNLKICKIFIFDYFEMDRSKLISLEKKHKWKYHFWKVCFVGIFITRLVWNLCLDMFLVISWDLGQRHTKEMTIYCFEKNKSIHSNLDAQKFRTFNSPGEFSIFFFSILSHKDGILMWGRFSPYGKFKHL